MYPKGVDFQSLELNVIDQREPRKRELNPRFIHFEARPLPKAWHRALPLGWEDPLVKEMATYSGILTWRIPWAEEPGGLQS